MQTPASIEAASNMVPDFSGTIPGQAGYPEFNFMNSAGQFSDAKLMLQPSLAPQVDYNLDPSFSAGDLGFADYTFDDVSTTSVPDFERRTDVSFFQQSNSAMQQHPVQFDNSLFFGPGFQYYQ